MKQQKIANKRPILTAFRFVYIFIINFFSKIIFWACAIYNRKKQLRIFFFLEIKQKKEKGKTNKIKNRLRKL